VQSIDLEESLIKIQFDDRTVDYEFNDLDEIALAYATHPQSTRFRIPRCGHANSYATLHAVGA
jgi:hypothetical protein